MGNDIAWLERRLNGEGAPVIIDGGMGTQLEKTDVPMNDKVWSGQAVLSHPEVVRQVHEDYIKAGAEVIIANTFATARHMLEPGGLGAYVVEINRNAVKLAQQAVDNAATKPVAIVGSICEWAPSESPKWASPEAIKESSREQAGLLTEAGVDLIALEMCESREMSKVAIEAALETELPVWAGLCAQTHKGCDHLSVFDYAELEFEPLVRDLAVYPISVMNIMHTPVSDIDESIEVVRRYWDGPLGIYPESGYFTMPHWNFVDVISPEELVDRAKGWIGKGARMMGGCCGLGPEHITALRDGLAH